jgi:hypothetical protein
VPLHFKKEADKTLDWFLKSGAIVPVPPHEKVEWVSPGFFVAKPYGKCRLVVDMRDINSFISRPVHPFPSPLDVVKKIKPDSNWFGSLDALSGYYPIQLDEESSFLTTFLLPQGQFCFFRAPMGMKNSSDVFCHRTDDILSDVPDIIKIVDYWLLQVETEGELLSILRIALVACRKGNLTLSKDKIKWGQKIGFAGYIMSNTLLYPDPARTHFSDSPISHPKRSIFIKRFSRASKPIGTFLARFGTYDSESKIITKEGC